MKLHARARARWAAPVILFFAQATIAAPTPNWTLIEDTDAVLATPVCRIEVSSANARFAIAFPKDASILPVVYTKITGLAQPAQQAQIRFAKKEFQPLYLFKAADEGDIYWYAPKDLPRLFALMSDQSTLGVAFNPESAAPVPALFKVSGFPHALELASKCLKAKTALPTDFLAALNTPSPFTGQLPSTVSPAVALAQVELAYKDYVTGLPIADQLAKLRLQMKPLATVEAAQTKDLARKQAALDQTSTTLAARQTDLTTTQARLVQSATDLANLQTAKTAAAADLVAKKAAYLPAVAALVPFQNAIAAQSKTLAAARAQVTKLQNRINYDVNGIATDHQQAANLKNEISDLESQISSARSDVSEAESNLNSYNTSWEAERILDSDWSYQNAKRELPEKQSEESRLQSQLGSDESRLNSARGSLMSCQSQPNANCSSQQSAVSEAENCVNNTQMRLSEAESCVSNDESTISREESEAQSQAESEHSRRQSAYDDAVSHLDGLQSDESSDASSLNNILNSAIPGLTKDLANSRAALATAQSQVATDEKAVADAQAALSAKRTEIGFDGIEAAYNLAVKTDADLAQAIAAKQASIATDTKHAAALPPVIASLTKTQTAQTTVRDAAATKLQATTAQLAPQRQIESGLVAQLATAKQGLADARALYQAELAKLPADEN